MLQHSTYIYIFLNSRQWIIDHRQSGSLTPNLLFKVGLWMTPMSYLYLIWRSLLCPLTDLMAVDVELFHFVIGRF